MMPEELISKRVDDRQLAPSFTDQEARGLIYIRLVRRVLDVGFPLPRLDADARHMRLS
jgi:hypothetical protein